MFLLQQAMDRQFFFEESQVRPSGRTAQGVKGISVKGEDKVVGMEILEKGKDQDLLFVTKKGYGKRTTSSEFKTQNRGGKGVTTYKITSKTGNLIKALRVLENDEVLIATNKGQTIRIKSSGISRFGRATQGVRLINLKADEFVTSVTCVNEDI